MADKRRQNSRQKKIYKVLRKAYRVEKYQEETKRSHGVISIESLSSELHSPLSVEETIEKEEVLRKLRTALNSLSPDEFDLINRNFFDGVPLAKIARDRSMSYIKCWQQRAKILKKLRELIGNIH